MKRLPAYRVRWLPDAVNQHDKETGIFFVKKLILIPNCDMKSLHRTYAHKALSAALRRQIERKQFQSTLFHLPHWTTTTTYSNMCRIEAENNSKASRLALMHLPIIIACTEYCAYNQRDMVVVPRGTTCRSTELATYLAKSRQPGTRRTRPLSKLQRRSIF